MKLLITVPWDEAQVQRVKKAFPSVEFSIELSEDRILHAVENTDIVFGDLSRNAFLKAKNLGWIQCHGAGVNKLVAIPELIASQVPITNTSGAHAPTIAEHFFGMLISLTRKLPDLYLAQRNGEWIDWGEWSKKVGSRPVGLLGMTIGIIGFGNIGRAIAERAAAFRMNVIAVEIRDLAKPDFVEEIWKLDHLPQLLKQSDVVAVTVPGTPQTTGLLGKDMLSLMKPTGFLGVVSRGGVVDEAALAQMLVENRLAGAALDVFQTEPLSKSSPLWQAPNVIITPHVSGKSEYTNEAATSIFIENLANYLAGKPLTNLVNKEFGF